MARLNLEDCGNRPWMIHALLILQQKGESPVRGLSKKQCWNKTSQRKFGVLINVDLGTNCRMTSTHTGQAKFRVLRRKPVLTIWGMNPIGFCGHNLY